MWGQGWLLPSELELVTGGKSPQWHLEFYIFKSYFALSFIVLGYLHIKDLTEVKLKVFLGISLGMYRD